MNESLFQFNLAGFSSFAVLAVGIFIYFRLTRRSAEDVLDDLGEYVPQVVSENSEDAASVQSKLNKERKQKEEFSFLRSLTTQESDALKKAQRLNVVIGCLMGLTLGFIAFKAKPILIVVLGISGLCFGYLYAQRKLRVLEEQFKKEIVFFLPVVMERIVMAVQAGLDILPALKVIEEIEKSGEEFKGGRSKQKIDAVTRLLAQVIKLCESGLSFDQSLREVANSIKSNALRHSFIHLAVAQKEGGELIYPLRELSDATQLYFQESIEEEIAKMPIKATMPLLLTFAGLIISFMTGPVVQILNVSVNPKLISEKADQKQEASEVSGVQH